MKDIQIIKQSLLTSVADPVSFVPISCEKTSKEFLSKDPDTEVLER
jgi:hypothetical protein